MTSIGDRVKALEGKYPQEVPDDIIHAILAKLTDAELDICERQAKLSESGRSDSVIKDILVREGKYDAWLAAYDHIQEEYRKEIARRGN